MMNVKESGRLGGSFLGRLRRRVPAGPSSNYCFRSLPVNPYSLLGEGAVIIDIGSRSKAGAYSFGKPPPGAKVLSLDIEDLPGVDIVGDAHDMHMIADNSIDCVISISMLEHVRDPHQVVREVYRILKPGGIIYANVPWVFAYHAVPDDFYRFSVNGIKYLCKDFEEIARGFNRGPSSAMADLLVRYFSILFSFGSHRIYDWNRRYVFPWPLFWIKYIDRLVGHFDTAVYIHAGAYFLGRKPGGPAVR